MPELCSLRATSRDESSTEATRNGNQNFKDFSFPSFHVQWRCAAFAFSFHFLSFWFCFCLLPSSSSSSSSYSISFQFCFFSFNVLSLSFMFFCSLSFSWHFPFICFIFPSIPLFHFLSLFSFHFQRRHVAAYAATSELALGIEKDTNCKGNEEWEEKNHFGGCFVAALGDVERSPSWVNMCVAAWRPGLCRSLGAAPGAVCLDSANCKNMRKPLSRNICLVFFLPLGPLCLKLRQRPTWTSQTECNAYRSWPKMISDFTQDFKAVKWDYGQTCAPYNRRKLRVG